MLAKGWLLGLQFEALFESNLYFDISSHAVKMADILRDAFSSLGYDFLVQGKSNQIFPILPNKLLIELSKNFTFMEFSAIDEDRTAVRFCTSWATTPESVEALCSELLRLS